MEKEEIIRFVENMKVTDHVILFYTEPEDKHWVLFTYLKAGLDRDEAAAYVAGQESTGEIRRAMKRFGIDVEGYEEKEALRIIDYRDWYIIGGSFDMNKTFRLWKGLLEEAHAKGFKGLRVTGEMACFFDHGMVKELVEYEDALHRTLEIPLAAICAYDSNVVAKVEGGNLFLNLIKAHSHVIIIGPKSGIIKSLA